jgi:NAD-dependent SIR2 family protein deacetylase
MIVEIDSDGALTDRSNAGILKPAVVMFGESIASIVKEAAEHAIDSCGRLLIVGTSLATYSAWRLAKRAQVRGMPIGIVNLGGVRGEEHFFEHLSSDQRGQAGVRIEMSSTQLLPGFVDHLRSHPGGSHSAAVDQSSPHFKNAGDYAFKDMLS